MNFKLKSKQLKIIVSIFKKLTKRGIDGDARYVTDREISKSYTELFGTSEGVREFMLLLNDKRHLLENKHIVEKRLIYAWQQGKGLDRMVFLTASQELIDAPFSEVVETIEEIINANIKLRNEGNGRH